MKGPDEKAPINLTSYNGRGGRADVKQRQRPSVIPRPLKVSQRPCVPPPANEVSPNEKPPQSVRNRDELITASKQLEPVLEKARLGIRRSPGIRRLLASSATDAVPLAKAIDDKAPLLADELRKKGVESDPATEKTVVAVAQGMLLKPALEAIAPPAGEAARLHALKAVVVDEPTVSIGEGEEGASEEPVLTEEEIAAIEADAMQKASLPAPSGDLAKAQSVSFVPTPDVRTDRKSNNPLAFATTVRDPKALAKTEVAPHLPSLLPVDPDGSRTAGRLAFGKLPSDGTVNTPNLPSQNPPPAPPRSGLDGTIRRPEDSRNLVASLPNPTPSSAPKAAPVVMLPSKPTSGIFRKWALRAAALVGLTAAVAGIASRSESVPDDTAPAASVTAKVKEVPTTVATTSPSAANTAKPSEAQKPSTSPETPQHYSFNAHHPKFSGFVENFKTKGMPVLARGLEKTAQNLSLNSNDPDTIFETFLQSGEQNKEANADGYLSKHLGSFRKAQKAVTAGSVSSVRAYFEKNNHEGLRLYDAIVNSGVEAQKVEKAVYKAPVDVVKTVLGKYRSAETLYPLLQEAVNAMDKVEVSGAAEYQTEFFKVLEKLTAEKLAAEKGPLKGKDGSSQPNGLLHTVKAVKQFPQQLSGLFNEVKPVQTEEKKTDTNTGTSTTTPSLPSSPSSTPSSTPAAPSAPSSTPSTTVPAPKSTQLYFAPGQTRPGTFVTPAPASTFASINNVAPKVDAKADAPASKTATASTLSNTGKGNLEKLAAIEARVKSMNSQKAASPDSSKPASASTMSPADRREKLARIEQQVRESNQKYAANKAAHAQAQSEAAASIPQSAEDSMAAVRAANEARRQAFQAAEAAREAENAAYVKKQAVIAQKLAENEARNKAEIAAEAPAPTVPATAPEAPAPETDQELLAKIDSGWEVA